VSRSHQTMTPEEYRALTRGGGSPSKYRATRKEYDGITYDSKAEAARAAELDVLLRVGEITLWLRQPRVRLGGGRVPYTPDFFVLAAPSAAWFEDVKGAETQRFRDIRRLWPGDMPLELRVLKRKRGRFVTEVIAPNKPAPSPLLPETYA